MRPCKPNWPRCKLSMICTPENYSAAHLLAALSGKKTDAAPIQYVQEIFSRLSNNFEKHLVDKLGYSVPQMFRDVLEKIVPEKLYFRNLLDLGCGTGLSGMAFRDISERMTGVDLSPEMIIKAKEKTIYDDLSVADLTEFLNATNQKFDLVIAADVFIYTGNLKPVFTSIAACLYRGAYFVFSTESVTGPGYNLQETGRYAHSSEYIESLAKDYGFIVKASDSVRIRKEQGEWIMGEIFILKFSGPS